MSPAERHIVHAALFAQLLSDDKASSLLNISTDLAGMIGPEAAQRTKLKVLDYWRFAGRIANTLEDV